jgi:hypothetical protein
MSLLDAILAFTGLICSIVLIACSVYLGLHGDLSRALILMAVGVLIFIASKNMFTNDP